VPSSRSSCSSEKGEEPKEAAAPAPAKEEAAPAKEEAAPSAEGGSSGHEYNQPLYDEDWHQEWKGDAYPSREETYPESWRFQDRQSDGKASPAKDYR